MPEELTARQQDVLRLTQEGKNPTEIGRELGISSQGVHGHLRKLRQSGHLPSDANPARPRPRRASADGGRTPFNAAGTLAAVQATINEQHARLNAREEEIDGQITALRAEKAEIGKIRKELEKLAPTKEAA